jgi:hypothetical protein
MSSISHIAVPPSGHTLALGLIMVTMTMILTVTTTTSISLVPPLVQSALADHGQEVVLSEKESSFAPKSSGEEGNQLKVVVNYAIRDPMTVNDLAKAVMKVYSPDGTLVKTSSSPTPFRITDNRGTVTLATTLTDTTVEDIIAKIVFTNPIKTETISNELPVSVDLIKGVTLSEEPQEEKNPQDLSQRDSAQDVPNKPLSEEFDEEASMIQENQQETSTESMPQTTTDDLSIPETSTAPPIITREICDDGIDNDGDILIDFSDRDCSSTQHQYQLRQQQEQTMGQTPEVCEDSLDNDLDGKIDNKDEECTTSSSSPSIETQSPQAQPSQLRLQQEQTMGQTPEVCEDSLDNDLDGKIDNKDEECTTSSSSPSIETQSPQAQPSVQKETGEEDKAKEQQSDEDISEESGEREGDDDDDKDSDDDDDDDKDSDDDDDDDDDDN